MPKSGRSERVNAGQSGDTSAGGLNRMDWLLRYRVDVLVLELGGNDGLRGLPAETTRKNLQAIIERTKAKYPGSKNHFSGHEGAAEHGPRLRRTIRCDLSRLAKKNQDAADSVCSRKCRRHARTQPARRHPPHRERPRNRRRQRLEGFGAGTAKFDPANKRCRLNGLTDSLIHHEEHEGHEVQDSLYPNFVRFVVRSRFRFNGRFRP